MSEDLVEYTKSLISYRSLDQLIKSTQRGMIRYKTTKGSTYGIGLFKNDDIAIQLAILTEGTIFPEHMHKLPVQCEYIHVIKGRLKVTRGEKTEIYNKYETIKIGCNELHKVEAMMDSEVIAITIPSDKSFPDAR